MDTDLWKRDAIRLCVGILIGMAFSAALLGKELFSCSP